MIRKLVICLTMVLAVSLASVSQKPVTRPSKPAAAAEQPKKTQKKHSKNKNASQRPQQSGRQSGYLIPDGTYRISPFLSRSYSLDNDANRFVKGNNVQIWQNYDNPAQTWRVENRQGGIVIHSGGDWNLVLDNDDCRSVNKNNIMIWETNYCPAQIWIPERVSGYDNVFILRYSGDTRFCIDLPGGKIYNGNNVELYEYWGGDNQKWIFIPR